MVTFHHNPGEVRVYDGRMGRTRHKGLAADYGGASPEDVARALHAREPRPRSHEENVARLLERRVVWPDELDDFSADEIEMGNVLLDCFDQQGRAGSA